MHEIPQQTIPITTIAATSRNHVNHPKWAFFHACQLAFILGSHHDGDLGNSSSNRVVNLVHIYVPAHHGHGHSSIRRFRLWIMTWTMWITLTSSHLVRFIPRDRSEMSNFFNSDLSQESVAGVSNSEKLTPFHHEVLPFRNASGRLTLRRKDRVCKGCTSLPKSQADHKEKRWSRCRRTNDVNVIV